MGIATNLIIAVLAYVSVSKSQKKIAGAFLSIQEKSLNNLNHIFFQKICIGEFLRHSKETFPQLNPMFPIMLMTLVINLILYILITEEKWKLQTNEKNHFPWKKGPKNFRSIFIHLAELFAVAGNAFAKQALQK